jgi:hypothetical protein
MNDEEFFEHLSKDAGALRYQPVDPYALERIRAGIAERLEPRVSPFDFLAGWSKAIAASLAAAALALAFGLYSLQSAEPVDLLGTSQSQVSLTREVMLDVD